eukprot:TRINITY_DN10776_c0_g1_i1.p1 TRINITY_DN10776_c0_g1~~TRINITY_DN10776_c0_g1_i1.p1  ORF type:complete len:373 (+),score=87.00 TRINITY_DN10776_c0_g1_i1:45-1121(+)
MNQSLEQTGLNLNDHPLQSIENGSVQRNVETVSNHRISNVKSSPSKRKRGTDCPLCKKIISGDNFEEHYQHELQLVLSTTKIEDIDKKKDERSKRLKSNPQAKNTKDETEQLLNKTNQVLDKIRKNRTNRDHRDVNVNPNEKSKTKCFICGEELMGDEIVMTQHIDRCLASQHNEEEPKSGGDESEEWEEGVETYTWDGQTRIRTCSLLEGGYSVADGVKIQNKEEDIELDVEEENDKYGKPQYSESDLIKLKDDDDDDDEEKAEDYEHLIPQHISNPEQVPMSMVDLLKIKINEQQALISKCPKCLICLEAYEVPLVSVECWHVHCEKCWLSSLGAKKLCPQCKVITSASDLRRIFL